MIQTKKHKIANNITTFESAEAQNLAWCIESMPLPKCANEVAMTRLKALVCQGLPFSTMSMILSQSSAYACNRRGAGFALSPDIQVLPQQNLY
ncbi:hypothetical protein [uncultured Helicobacter sp.]|uniref:hypothetical protein n=1 Tax=uncultured Helicobacter sp. TaxID=175537 RepID=UPI00374FD482